MSSEATRQFTIFVGFLALACNMGRAPKAEAPEAAPAPRTAGDSEKTQATVTGSDDQQGIFMSVLPIDASPQVKQLVADTEDHEDFAKRLRIRVQILRAYRDLGELSRRTKSRVVNGVFQLSDLSRPHLKSQDKPAPTQKQSSFVMDYDEPELAQAISDLEAAHESISPKQIEAFVSEYIAQKTYTRGFDIASRVATSRAGDCTEHAVLTTALLRHFGFHARLLFGVVLVGVHSKDIDPQLLAAGHAWVEVYDDAAWNIVDAALHLPQAGRTSDKAVGVPGLPEGTRVRLAYLPINVMHDEGPGYSRALMNEVGVDSIVRIDVDAVQPP